MTTLSEGQIVAICKEAAGFGVAEIALADTVGAADPWMVKSRIEATYPSNRGKGART